MATESTAEDKNWRKFKFDLLELKINESEKTISCTLKMPSQLPQKYDSRDQGINPTVFLDLQNSNADGNRCFQIMKEIVHPNILHVRGINTTKSQLLLWVEPYTGNLLNLLGMILRQNHSSAMARSKTTALPTCSIQKIVSQVLDGLKHLKIQGSYHGNFTMEGTYYHMIKLEIFVKLTNFKEKGAKKSVRLYQLEDLRDLGTELMLLSSTADKLNKESSTGHMFDTFILDDLAHKLKLVTLRNLDKTYEVIKKHPFFWNGHERKRFFIYRVAVKMKNPNFRTKVRKCKALCSLPWDANSHNGFVQMMNQFRAKKKKPDYNGLDMCDFVLFICAMYAHEHQPPLNTCGKKVDDTVTNIHPRVCLLLSNLLQGSDDDWL